MQKIKFPENIELAKRLRHGDIKLIAKATNRSHSQGMAIFNGRRRLTPRIKSAYEIVIKMNNDMERALSEAMASQKENYHKKHPKFIHNQNLQ